MNKLSNVTIGTDIEVFIKDITTNEIVSAEPYIKGTKHNPFNFDISSKFYATSLDNVLAEFCIPPSKTKDEFVKGINKSMDYIQSILPKGFCTVSIPSAVLDMKYLQTDNARLFGCEADLNVWLRRQNDKPTATNEQLRSAGLHVHVGYDNSEIEITEQAVKAMDLFLSVPSLLIEPDNERRKLYGMAGAFRLKDYGFEHRVLSSYFSKDDNLKSWVFDNTLKAINFVNEDRIEEIEAVADQIQNAINSNDKVLAGNLIRQFSIDMP